MKKAIFITITIVVLAPIVLYVLFWFFLGSNFFLHDIYTKNRLPNPPQPEITYAEFPFRIELDNNGEQIIFDDTIICEYVGVKYISGAERKVREWRIKLESEKDFEVKQRIKTIFRVEVKNHAGNYMHVNYRYGTANYYMGDMGENEIFNPQIEISINDKFSKGFKNNDEILDYYGIKIISIEETPPIKNTFK